MFPTCKCASNSTTSEKQNSLDVIFAKDLCPEPRGKFAYLQDHHVKYFKSILGDTGVITRPEELTSYNEFWLKFFRGTSKIVLLPKTTEEVSKILSFCNDHRLAVCPQGGNTSISGGSIPVFDEIILSLSRMNKIISIDEVSGVLVCEAGCVLENLDKFLSDKNLMMPIDLASKGSCQIGGNVSSNAGGLRLLRFGNFHGSVLGLEAVKANGEVVDCLNDLKKDNTGYHLKHLFIGSEGTLGVVTKVSIKCATIPKAYSLAFLGLNSYDDVLATFKCAKDLLNETLSACEMMDWESIDMVQSNLNIKNVLGDFPFYMLIEACACTSKHNEENLNTFLKTCFDKGLIIDGIMTADPPMCRKIWEVRERVAESNQKDGYVLMYDLSFSLKDFYTLVPYLTKLLGKKVKRVSGLGHLGDGNIHLQVTLYQFDEKLKNYIDDIVFKKVSELKGSISAEHGIGFMKTDKIHYSKSPSAIKLMYSIKQMFDPKGILNPYKVLKCNL